MGTSPDSGATWAAAALLGISALWFLVLAVRNRPIRPPVARPVDEPGPEPPAVVHLLTHGFALTHDAATATLVDLTARGWFSVEDHGPEGLMIRLIPGDRDLPVTPYEARMLAHLETLSHQGLVPAGALRSGAKRASDAWWRAFRREVIADAAARGLTRDRWPSRRLWPVRLGAAGIFGLLGLARYLGERSGESQGFGPLEWLWGLVAVGAVALFVGAQLLARRDAQLGTPAGLAAASRWRGFGQYLTANPPFWSNRVTGLRSAGAADDSRPVWDRRLAYAVALDLEPQLVARLPMGTEDHRRAWSSASGGWRAVQVTYPVARPGYGRSPWFALAGAVVMTGVMAVLVLAVFRLQFGDGSSFPELEGGAALAVDVGSAFIATAAIIAVAWNLAKLLMALGDLTTRTQVREGVVVRKRVRDGWFGLDHDYTYTSHTARPRRQVGFVALDDGGSHRLVAWRVSRAIYERVEQGNRYRAWVTPGLGYVHRLEPLSRKVERTEHQLGRSRSLRRVEHWRREPRRPQP